MVNSKTVSFILLMNLTICVGCTGSSNDSAIEDTDTDFGTDTDSDANSDIGTDAYPDTDTDTATDSDADAASVIINEVMASNFSGATDEDGDVEDWVELYNTSEREIDLSGWGLSNKPASPFRWVFPSGTSLWSKAYLRVWLSKKDRTRKKSDLHTNFNLDNGSDKLVLSAPNATISGVEMDTVSLPLTRPDVSFCRLPNGTVAAMFQHCINPTPGTANSGAGYLTMLARPGLSIDSGIYAISQRVNASGPAGAQVRYTLDGSEPGATSSLYDGPITISHSTTLRVAAFRDDAVTSPVETGTYIIDAANHYVNQRAIFLTMSPDDMSHYKDGDRPLKGWIAHAAMTAPGGALLFSAPLQGSDAGQLGSYNGQDNNPIDLKFKDALGIRNVKVAGLFAAKPGTTRFKHLKLRNSGDDYWYAHMRDQFWQGIMEDKLAPGAASEPVQVFTNGTYYGMMDFREKEDETLITATYGVDKDNVQYLNDDKELSGTNTTDDYRTARDYILWHSMAEEANYEQAGKLIDVENFAQYFALHMFAADRDWLWRNMHRFRMPDYDGRWRWRPHDLDISAGGHNAWGYDTSVDENMNNFYGDYDVGDLMNALLENPSFEALYISIVADQLNTTLAPAVLNARLDAIAAEMLPYMEVHWAAFPDATRGGSYLQWKRSIDELRNFLNNRESYYDVHTRARFDLSERKSLTVSVNDPAMGAVKVNTIDLSSRLSGTAFSWTGKYYPEVQVTLEARPRPGYVFVGWKEANTSTTAAISVSVATDNLTYQAVFAPAGTVKAPTVAAIAPQTFLTGEVVSLDVSATDPAGYELSYSARNLPSGLSISVDTGRIYGKPTKKGAFDSTITATNNEAATTIDVPWQINNRVPE